VESIVLVMVGYGNKRTLEGKERDCPVPLEGYDLGALTRWRHIRDGLRVLIERLPWTEKGTVARLQEVWAYACKKVEDLEAKEPPEWVLPF
jgi:hypothetical protein